MEEKEERNGTEKMNDKDKISVFAEQTKTVLTLSSASLPVIVALLGLFAVKGQDGVLAFPPFVKDGLWAVKASLVSFSLAILSGVFYNFFLTLKVNSPTSYDNRLTFLSIVLHLAFLMGVLFFAYFAWSAFSSLS